MPSSPRPVLFALGAARHRVALGARSGWWLLTAGLWLGVGGCADDLPDPAIVTSPRIVAIQATPVAAAPGGEVVLRALVASPPGGTPPVLRWWGCPLPDGADPRGCLPPGALAVSPLGADGARTTLEGAAGAAVVVHVAACPDAEPPRIVERLDAIRCPDGELAQLAFKRLGILSPGAETPRNPDLGAFTVTPADGCDPDRCRHDLSLEVRDAVTSEEAPLTDFLASDGEIDTYRVAGTSPRSSWLPSARRPSVVRFWAISRDGVGATAWREAELSTR